MKRIVAGLLLALMIVPILFLGFTQNDFNSFWLWVATFILALGIALFQRLYAFTDGYETDDIPSNTPRAFLISAFTVVLGKFILKYTGYGSQFFIIELIIFFVVFMTFKFQLRTF